MMGKEIKKKKNRISDWLYTTPTFTVSPYYPFELCPQHPSRPPSDSFKRRFRVKILYVFLLCPIPSIHSNHNLSSIFIES
jgi:hypothetical protein